MSRSFFDVFLLAPYQQAEAQEGEGGVQEEEFVAELVAAEPAFGVELEDEADGRREERHDGHVPVLHLLFRQDAEGKESQDGPVGVTGQFVDRVDGAGAVEGVEDDDGHRHQDGHGDVDGLPDLDLAGLVQDVHREGGREGGEGRSARAVGADHEADDEKDAYDGRKEAGSGGGGEELVARLGDSVGRGELVQERAQAQESGDDDRLEEAAHDEVLL